MNRAKQYGLLLTAFFALAGCALIQEHEAGTRVIVMAATLKVIDGDAATAERVEEIATEVAQFASESPEGTVDALIMRTRSLIRWDRLDDTERLLIDTLLEELSAGLTERLGESEIPEQLQVTVAKVSEWVITAARMASTEE